MSNPRYFVWYHFKIVICRNFDIRNGNAKSALKIGMIPQKSKWLASLAVQRFFFILNKLAIITCFVCLPVH